MGNPVLPYPPQSLPTLRRNTAWSKNLHHKLYYILLIVNIHVLCPRKWGCSPNDQTTGKGHRASGKEPWHKHSGCCWFHHSAQRGMMAIRESHQEQPRRRLLVKELKGWRGRRRDIWEALEGENGRGKWSNYTIISTNKWNNFKCLYNVTTLQAVVTSLIWLFHVLSHFIEYLLFAIC